MKKAVILLLLGLMAGGAFLYRWYMHGSWKENGHTLIEHDVVRFGPIPMFFTVLWLLTGVVTLILAVKILKSKLQK